MTIRPARDPFWPDDGRKLNVHWIKHPIKGKGGCRQWSALFGGKCVSEDDYREYSIGVPHSCWLVFAAEQIKPEQHKRGRNHLDESLIRTITDLEHVPPRLLDVSKIRTCFHDHLIVNGIGRCGAPYPADETVNDMKLRYVKHLGYRLSYGDFKDFELGNPARTPPQQIQNELKVMVAKHA